MTGTLYDTLTLNKVEINIRGVVLKLDRFTLDRQAKLEEQGYTINDCLLQISNSAKMLFEIAWELLDEESKSKIGQSSKDLAKSLLMEDIPTIYKAVNETMTNSQLKNEESAAVEK